MSWLESHAAPASSAAPPKPCASHREARETRLHRLGWKRTVPWNEMDLDTGRQWADSLPPWTISKPEMHQLSSSPRTRGRNARSRSDVTVRLPPRVASDARAEPESKCLAEAIRLATPRLWPRRPQMTERDPDLSPSAQRCVAAQRHPFGKVNPLASAKARLSVAPSHPC